MLTIFFCERGRAKIYIKLIYFDMLLFKVNSVPDKISIGSFIFIVKTFKFKYNLIVISRVIILDMLRTGLGRGVGQHILTIIF